MQIKYNVLDQCKLGYNQTKSLGKLLPGPDSFVKGISVKKMHPIPDTLAYVKAKTVLIDLNEPNDVLGKKNYRLSVELATGKLEIGDSCIPVNRIINLVGSEVFVYIPKCAVVNWIDRHTCIVAPIQRVLFVSGPIIKRETARAWLAL
jgi:hypothetical protein